MSESLISAEGVRFTYASENDESEPVGYVLDGVDLDVKKGEFLAVLGHNGSGKSTIAKHFNAILLPDEGSVSVDGINTPSAQAVQPTPEQNLQSETQAAESAPAAETVRTVNGYTMPSYQPQATQPNPTKNPKTSRGEKGGEGCGTHQQGKKQRKKTKK